tara:strand:+ start:229 stop:669 length:441 start_codon:yes stop_codon:yes gene_type:complete
MNIFKSKIKLINKSNNPDPRYETANSAGMDLRANEDAVIKKGSSVVVGTGLFMEIPKGYEGQIRSRSGLAAKKQIIVLNSPGTIDSDYRGEIKIILINLGKSHYSVLKGDRIAQIVFAPCEQMKFKSVEFLEDTDRGSGGLGSTGV